MYCSTETRDESLGLFGGVMMTNKDHILSCGGINLLNEVTKECYFLNETYVNWQLSDIELSENKMFPAISSSPQGNLLFKTSQSACTKHCKTKILMYYQLNL